MKTLYLHIGVHKTGSTSIQDFLFKNAKLLENQGYFYPTGGSYYHRPSSSQSLLALSLLEKKPSHLSNIIFTKAGCIKDIQKDIEGSRSENIIVSSEHFRHMNSLDQIIELKNVFLPVVDYIKVIVYLRRQDLVVESAWTQKIKTGSLSISFEDYVDYTIDFADKVYDHFDYNGLLENFSKVFGVDNLFVRVFEKGQLHQGCVVMDFLNLIGIKQLKDSIKRLNEAPSIERIEVIRSIVGKVESQEARAAFIRLLKFVPLQLDESKYSLFSNEARENYLRRYKESNAKVAKNFLHREDEVLFYEPCKNLYPVYPGLSNARINEISDVIFSFLGYSKNIKK